MFDKKSDKQPRRGVFLTVLLLKCFNNQCENSFHPTCRPWHKMFYSIQYTLYIIRRIKSVLLLVNMQTELDIYAILICHSLHQMNVLITYRLLAGRVAKSNAEFSHYLIKGWVDKEAILAISWQFSQIKLLASKVWTWT